LGIVIHFQVNSSSSGWPLLIQQPIRLAAQHLLTTVSSVLHACYVFSVRDKPPANWPKKCVWAYVK